MAVEEAFAKGPADSDVAGNVAEKPPAGGRRCCSCGADRGWVDSRGVVPTRTRFACARVAERPRRAALISAPSWSPVSVEETQMFLAPGVLVQPRECRELMQEEVMVG